MERGKVEIVALEALIVEPQPERHPDARVKPVRHEAEVVEDDGGRTRRDSIRSIQGRERRRYDQHGDRCSHRQAKDQLHVRFRPGAGIFIPGASRCTG